jgi:hypothetical protein
MSNSFRLFGNYVKPFWLGGNKRKAQLSLLMPILARDPDRYKSVSELAETSSLGELVYPLLGWLKRQGLVEHIWTDTCLAYRLTASGLEWARFFTN